MTSETMRWWVIPMRGATAYEWQWGRLGLRICHLCGRFWAWRPWRRFKFQWWPAT